jgi:hypothetical protein
MKEAREARTPAINMAFWYDNSIHYIKIIDYTIKCRLNAGLYKVVKKISLPDRNIRREKPSLEGARTTDNYLVIYGLHEIISIKLENLFDRSRYSVRSKVYHVNKAVDANNYERLTIVDILYVEKNTIAVGMVDLDNKQVAIAFIDQESDNIRHTGKFGSNTGLVKLARHENGKRVIALCDRGGYQWEEYYPQLEVRGDLEIYTIDVKTATVTAKKTFRVEE